MLQDLYAVLRDCHQCDKEELFQQWLKGILQGRPQTTDEVAPAALLLVSDHASAITGQILNVDAGMVFY
jgi:enoyl-[acyl-carrier-protein] reductase (NADH)